MFQNSATPFELWRPPTDQVEVPSLNEKSAARFSYPPVTVRDPASTVTVRPNSTAKVAGGGPVSPPGCPSPFPNRVADLRTPEMELMMMTQATPQQAQGQGQGANLRIRATASTTSTSVERSALDYLYGMLRNGLPVNLSVLKANWAPFQPHLGTIEEFLLGHSVAFRVDWGISDESTLVRRIGTDLGPNNSPGSAAFIQPPRRLHNKILTLLSLSPTYSYDVEMLRHELGWDEARQGNFQQYLASTMKQDGKQLFTLSMSNGRYRVHLIKDIYLNAVSQKLRALYEKHYKTSNELLTVEMMRRFLFWDCPTRQFKDFLLSHGLGKLLAPPARTGSGASTPTPPIAAPVESPPTIALSPSGTAVPESARPVRPQIIRSVSHLTSVMSFVKQQYNLVSVVCYAGKTPHKGLPMLSLIRLTQANKQVILVDLVALSEEAQHQWMGPGENFDLKQAGFVNELRSLMSSEDIRKCVWNFKPFIQMLEKDFGVTVTGLIDMYPIVNYFFPEFLKDSLEDDGSGFPCPRIIAEKLAAQIWKASDFVPPPHIPDWHHRPLTTDMITRAACIGVGALLDIRKGARTELSTRVNEKMTQVSELYYTTGELATASSTFSPFRAPELSKLLTNDNSEAKSGLSPGLVDDTHSWLFSSPGLLRGFDQGFDFGDFEGEMINNKEPPSLQRSPPSPPNISPLGADDEPIENNPKWNQAIQIFSQFRLSTTTDTSGFNPMTFTSCSDASELSNTLGPNSTIGSSSVLEPSTVDRTGSGGAFLSPSSRPNSPVVARPEPITRSPPIGATPTSPVPLETDSFARTLATGYDSGFVLGKGLA